MSRESNRLQIGKLPPELLRRLLREAPQDDDQIVVGPGVGIDCAVIDVGPNFHVYKSDPITFATDEIGWYAVQVNVNDIATAGAVPRWFLFTLLLPADSATESLAEIIFQQVYQACKDINVSVIGGHSEITHGLDRPILMGSLVGEVERDRLITSRGARHGDRILLTKWVPIETTAILARDFPDRVSQVLDRKELQKAANFLYKPGISVLDDARIAVRSGEVTAMHDPTEGGISTALWELSEASQRRLIVKPDSIQVHPISRQICEHFELDPFGSIASGALLLTVVNDDAEGICHAIRSEGIDCSVIGRVATGEPGVWRETESGFVSWPRPERDEISKVFE